MSRQPSDRVVVALPQVGGGLGEQPGNRNDGVTEGANPRIGPVARRDPIGRGQRVLAATTDFVGARQNADRRTRRRLRHLLVVERFEETNVVAMYVVHQIDDGVSLGRKFVCGVQKVVGS